MKDNKRLSFKFFRSFYEAALQIEDKAQRSDFLMAVCGYALDQEILPELSGVAAALFMLAKPNIDVSRNKSSAGMKGGQANAKQSESKSEANAKQSESDKGKGKREKGYRDTPPLSPPEGEFEKFWTVYPKKVGKQSAKKAFVEAIKLVNIETLVTAVERQKCSRQWSKDNGQYIPNPSTWLKEGRWEDELEKELMQQHESGNADDFGRMQKMLDNLKGGET